MYEVKRCARALELKLGDEVLKVYLGGIFQYKKLVEADEKISLLLKSLKTNSDNKDAQTMLGLSIMNEMEIIFGKTNAEKILAFFEENYDEMLSSLLPFLQGEYIPAMLENIKKLSKEKVKTYK